MSRNFGLRKFEMLVLNVNFTNSETSNDFTGAFMTHPRKTTMKLTKTVTSSFIFMVAPAPGNSNFRYQKVVSKFCSSSKIF